MKPEDIKTLTPKQLATHPAIKNLEQALWGVKIVRNHEDNCDHDGMDVCPCGHAQLWYALKALGIKV